MSEPAFSWPTSGLVKREEAARFCRMSPQSFDAHVRPGLTEKRAGRLLFFLRSELEEWANQSAAAGLSVNARRATRTPFVSGLLAEKLSDPRVQRTKLRLVGKRRESTPTKSVGHQSQSGAEVAGSTSRSS